MKKQKPTAKKTIKTNKKVVKTPPIKSKKRTTTKKKKTNIALSDLKILADSLIRHQQLLAEHQQKLAATHELDQHQQELLHNLEFTISQIKQQSFPADIINKIQNIKNIQESFSKQMEDFKQHQDRIIEVIEELAHRVHSIHQTPLEKISEYQPAENFKIEPELENQQFSEFPIFENKEPEQNYFNKTPSEEEEEAQSALDGIKVEINELLHKLQELITKSKQLQKTRNTPMIPPNEVQQNQVQQQIKSTENAIQMLTFLKKSLEQNINKHRGSDDLY